MRDDGIIYNSSADVPHQSDTPLSPKRKDSDVFTEIEEGCAALVHVSFRMSRSLFDMSYQKPLQPVCVIDGPSSPDEEDLSDSSKYAKKKEGFYERLEHGFRLRGVANRIMLGIGQELYMQSQFYSQRESSDIQDYTGVRKLFFENSERDKDGYVRANVVMPKGEVREVLLDENGNQPIIYIRMRKFVQNIYGGSVDNSTYRHVRSLIVDEMCRKYIQFTDEDGNKVEMPLMTILQRKPPKCGEDEELKLMLNPYFSENVMHCFVAFPKDVFSRIKPLRSDMDWALFICLVSMPKKYGFHKNLKELLSFIATSSQYSRRRRERMRAFLETVERMKKVGIITGIEVTLGGRLLNEYDESTLTGKETVTFLFDKNWK